jgi:hypothetical protein
LLGDVAVSLQRFDEDAIALVQAPSFSLLSQLRRWSEELLPGAGLTGLENRLEILCHTSCKNRALTTPDLSRELPFDEILRIREASKRSTFSK